jgi:hypothetical protein
MTERVGTDLLRALGSGVAPVGTTRHNAPAAAADFSALLDRARTGAIRSGLTVTANPDLNLELDAGQTETLSRIADLAQAQGVDRVLVTDGANAFILDVESRTLTERAPAGGGGLVTGIDAVAHLDEPFIVDDDPGVASDALLSKLSRFGRAAG